MIWLFTVVTGVMPPAVDDINTSPLLVICVAGIAVAVHRISNSAQSSNNVR